MVTYIYDGTFEGLLTALHMALRTPEEPCRMAAAHTFEPDLFARAAEVHTDTVAAADMRSLLEKRLTSDEVDSVYYAFLSEIPSIEDHILEYVRLGLKIGGEVRDRLTNENVRHVTWAREKVLRECHRMAGLLRFRELKDDILYAPFEPDHNVVSLLAPHFAARMPEKRWIIHDVKRSLAAVGSEGEWRLCVLSFDDTPFWTSEEFVYQRLWQEFFHSIAIRERENPRLQKSHMPTRYWKYLIEKDV